MYTSTPEIYTLSLHDALPISVKSRHAAPLDPLARRSGTNNRQARIDWRALESRLAQAEHGCLAPKPLLAVVAIDRDRKSTRLNSSHLGISYAVFCLKKKNETI